MPCLQTRFATWGIHSLVVCCYDTTEELRELIFKSQELYPKIWPGIKWSERKMQWTAPSGARLWMSYLDRDEDVLRYQGLAFSWIGFDELTQWGNPYAWNYMRSRLRSTAPDLPIFMRATTNPGGRGHHWVKKMFIDPSPYGKAFDATDIETHEILRYPAGHSKAGKPLFKRRFIPARLSDNPYLSETGDYEAMLLSLPEQQRRQLLDGDWDIKEGAAFTEFDRDIHVIEPLIFLAIGLNLEHVITAMVLTVVLYGALSLHRLSKSLCTGNCMCQKS